MYRVGRKDLHRSPVLRQSHCADLFTPLCALYRTLHQYIGSKLSFALKEFAYNNRIIVVKRISASHNRLSLYTQRLVVIQYVVKKSKKVTRKREERVFPPPFFPHLPPPLCLLDRNGNRIPVFFKKGGISRRVLKGDFIFHSSSSSS